MKVTRHDPNLPHQIQIITAKRGHTLAGQECHDAEIVVTCNCWARNGGYSRAIALAPDVPTAWRWWNVARLHSGDDFVPNENKIQQHGTAEPFKG